MNEQTVWSKVRKGFAILHKQGCEARMNFWCCMSCACNALDDDNRPRKVYFHKQDTGHYKNDGKLPIRYFVEQGKDSDKVQEEKCLEHAKNIKAVLEGVGCKVEWSGRTDDILEVVG